MSQSHRSIASCELRVRIVKPEPASESKSEPIVDPPDKDILRNVEMTSDSLSELSLASKCERIVLQIVVVGGDFEKGCPSLGELTRLQVGSKALQPDLARAGPSLGICQSPYSCHVGGPHPHISACKAGLLILTIIEAHLAKR